MIRRAKEKLMLQYDSTVNFFADALMRIRTHEGFKRYLKNTGWLFLGRIVNLGISFIVGVFVVRYLGPQQYGLLSYSVSFAGMFSFIAALGLDAVLQRELILFPEKRDDLLGTSFLLKFIGSLIALLLLAISLHVMRVESRGQLFAFIVAGSFIFQSFYVIGNYFQANVLSKQSTVISMIVSSILVILKMSFIYVGAPLVYFAFVFLLESICYAIGYLYIYGHNDLSWLTWKFDHATAKILLRDAWPLMFSSAFLMIYTRIDQILIRFFMNDSSVGIYDVGVRLSEMWYFIPGLLCTALFPAIINAKKTNSANYKKRLQHFYSLILYIAVAIFLPLSLFATFFVRMFYGNSFIGAADIVRIYAWSGLPAFIGMALGQYLIAENYIKISLVANLLGMAINVALNIAFIPLYGIKGAAFATLISYSVVPITILSFKKTREQGVSIIRAVFLKYV